MGKWDWKVQRAMRSWERAAQEIDAVDLLPHVLREQVENTVLHNARDREAIARRILLAMKERANADDNR